MARYLVILFPPLFFFFELAVFASSAEIAGYKGFVWKPRVIERPRSERLPWCNHLLCSGVGHTGGSRSFDTISRGNQQQFCHLPMGIDESRYNLIYFVLLLKSRPGVHETIWQENFCHWVFEYYQLFCKAPWVVDKYKFGIYDTKSITDFENF